MRRANMPNWTAVGGDPRLSRPSRSELAGVEAHARRARARPRDAGARRGRGEAAARRWRPSSTRDPRRAAAQGRRRRQERHLEVRAGTGGDEAALFAGDLFRMYVKYAEVAGWRVEVLSESEGTAGGYKEIVAEVAGRGRLRAAQVRERRPSGAARAGDRDAGAHPHLRRHRRGDARGRGGRRRYQRRAISRSTRCAPRAPAASTSTRRNRRSASPICRPASSCRAGGALAAQEPRAGDGAAALAPLRRRAQNAPMRSAPAERKSRSAPATGRERIRTYNFPQGRMTDHRINLTLYKLDKVMEGEGAGRGDRRARRRPAGAAARRAGRGAEGSVVGIYTADRYICSYRRFSGATQEARVRVGLVICVGAALLAAVGPAHAQFGVPFGGSGMLTAPEAVSGAFGAGAAHSAQQQQCQTVYSGREGPRTVCSPSAQTPASRR